MYLYLHYGTTEDNSILDDMTLSKSLNNRTVSWIAVLATLLISIMIYFLVFRLSRKMMHFEFQENQFKDFFIASHSIVVRGINPDISVEKSNKAVRKVFEKWFSKRVVLAVHT